MKIQVEDKDCKKIFYGSFKNKYSIPKIGDIYNNKWVVYSGLGDIISESDGNYHRYWVIIISKNNIKNKKQSAIQRLKNFLRIKI